MKKNSYFELKFEAPFLKMSLSDFSISSPRKSKYGEKSLTNEEDFENFLNDEVF